MSTLTKQIDDLLIQQCQESNIAFQPMYPWVIVRVCNKEQKKGEIWLPNSDQNKTIHEGIVLSTWPPCTRVIDDRTEMLVSELRRGDHVLFSHFAGVPIEGRGSGYRFVKERDWGIDKEGGIMATVEYNDKATGPVAKLRDIIENHPQLNVACDDDDLVAKILDLFILVDKHTPSVTLSGR
jgi:co-chaperonin GroES (HSP10)